MSATQTRPKDADEVQSIVRESAKVLPRGAGTKETLSRAADDAVTIVEMGALSGVLEYDPGEYTITALAGTPVKDVSGQLAEHGQWLPFDPLLVERGATLGGTVASGLSGPGRFRYGGIRDFLVGEHRREEPHQEMPRHPFGPLGEAERDAQERRESDQSAIDDEGEEYEVHA